MSPRRRIPAKLCARVLPRSTAWSWSFPRARCANRHRSPERRGYPARHLRPTRSAVSTTCRVAGAPALLEMQPAGPHQERRLPDLPSLRLVEMFWLRSHNRPRMRRRFMNDLTLRPSSNPRRPRRPNHSCASQPTPVASRSPRANRNSSSHPRSSAQRPSSGSTSTRLVRRGELGRSSLLRRGGLPRFDLRSRLRARTHRRSCASRRLQ